MAHIMMLQISMAGQRSPESSTPMGGDLTFEQNDGAVVPRVGSMSILADQCSQARSAREEA